MYPELYDKEGLCVRCGSTNICHSCNGSGKNGQYPCPTCNGDGDCKFCHGKKRLPQIIRQ